MDKKVHLELIGLDGNAFSVIGAFRNQAKKENWTQGEIQSVLDEAMRGDYNHLLATIIKFTTSEKLKETHSRNVLNPCEICHDMGEVDCDWCDNGFETIICCYDEDCSDCDGYGEYEQTCLECNGYQVVDCLNC